MTNVSHSDSGGPSRVPKRGVVALVTTVLAVALLFGFKPAAQNGLDVSIPSSAIVDRPRTETTAPIAAGPQGHASPTTPVPTARPAERSTPQTGPAQATPGEPLGPVAPPTPTSPPAAAGGANGTFVGDAVDTA